MALLTEDVVLKRAERQIHVLQKSVTAALTEAAGPNDRFDVFLSHSSAESEKLLLGVKGLLEDQNLTVYVDRYSDSQLSPENVTIKTAALLRKRLRASRSLLYVYSRHSTKSRWMPWELGFFDGIGRPLGILPVVQSTQSAFQGEEYLGLYPYVDQATAKGGGSLLLWANHISKKKTYAPLADWVETGALQTHS